MHLCPRTYPAPYTESRTDIFRPLTHPRRPQCESLSFERLGIDSAAIVTNQHAQEGAQVLNFNLDLVASE